MLSEIKKQKKKPVISYNVVSSNGGSDVDRLSASPQHKNGEGIWRRFNSDHKEVGMADSHKDSDQLGLLKEWEEEEEEEEKGSGAEEKKKEVTNTEVRL